jgi:signal transduction histidine kinase
MAALRPGRKKLVSGQGSLLARRIRAVGAWTAAVAVSLTVLIAVLPFTSFAYRSPTTHIAIETAATLIALVACYLLVGRLRMSGRLSDLLLVTSLAMFAAANLVFAVVPAAARAADGQFSTWGTLTGQLLAAALFAAAAVAPEIHLRRPGRAALVALGGIAAAVALVALFAALAGPKLPAAIDPALSPESSGRPRVVGDASVLALQVVLMCLYALAAVGFVRQAERHRDELIAFIAVAATLGAAARLNYFLFPSIYSEWVYTGDVFRLTLYAVLLVGALRQVARYQRRIAEGAVLDERRRIARELHDGLAQELAYISSQSRRLRAEPAARHIATAAERALDESRAAISALTRPADEPLDVSVAQMAEALAGRAGANVELELSRGIEVAPQTQQALLRILREALTNATRHAGASAIRVELVDGPAVRLRVSDNGRGFDPRERGHGFGLTSMRERAQAIGGELSVSSEPGDGTAVEVVVP